MFRAQYAEDKRAVAGTDTGMTSNQLRRQQEVTGRPSERAFVRYPLLRSAIVCPLACCLPEGPFDSAPCVWLVAGGGAERGRAFHSPARACVRVTIECRVELIVAIPEGEGTW